MLPRLQSNARLLAGSLAVVCVLATTTAAAPASAAPPASSVYVAATDPYSMANTTAFMGARGWWKSGYTGAGVDVAVIDSGVAPVRGLDLPGKVLYGPDLSFESQSDSLRNLDTYGHGTFMAGLIAGNDGGSEVNPAPDSYRGVAPDARIVSLKVATADGGTDVTQVIAAIDWVVQHRQDPGMNVRVLSLSYGTNSLQPARIDPLAYAAEQAWKAGIVVVVSAGNAGYQRGNNAPGLADPGYDPMLIGVGGYDTNGTATPNDDFVGDYSVGSKGCAMCKSPDFLAVGSHLQGLRVPGSYIDQMHPEGLISDRYFRGTGTSQAAAITAGAVALILQKYPDLTPDQVKRFMAVNGTKLAGVSAQMQGGGEIALGALANAVPAQYQQTVPTSTGAGSLESSRGTDRVTMDGTPINGSQDIFGHLFKAKAMAAAEAQRLSWSGGTWNGNVWSGSSWDGQGTPGVSWTSADWSGRSWTGRSWTDCTWSSNAWDGRSWTGRSWTGTSWSGRSWTGRSWSDAAWG